MAPGRDLVGTVGGVAVEEEEVGGGAIVVAGADAVGLVVEVEECAVEEEDGVGVALDLA
jgi:hypothetical protein